ncbi:hypothetical protein J7J69_00215 [candidate division WOR-3 bacterium]|nr:hypothetical protein [candidate division WOR-3 bacterium]
MKEGRGLPSNFLINSVEFEGEYFFADSLKDITEDFVGKSLNPSAMDSLLHRIQVVYLNNGFPFVKLVPFYSIKDSLVDIRIGISSGGLKYIRRLIFRGRGNLSLLRRLSSPIEGKVFCEKRLKEEIGLINMGKIFQVDSFRLVDGKDSVDIEVFVGTKSESRLLFGAGYRADKDYSLHLNGGFFNPFGYGSVISVNVDRESWGYTFIDGSLDIPLFPLKDGSFLLDYYVRTFSDTLLIQSFSFYLKFRSFNPSVLFKAGVRKNTSVSEIIENSTDIILSLDSSPLGLSSVYVPGKGRLFKGIIRPVFWRISPYYRFVITEPDSVKLKENYLSPVRGYFPGHYGRLYGAGAELYIIKSKNMVLYTFLDFVFGSNIRSAGIGLKTGNYNLEISFPDFNLKTTMLWFRGGGSKDQNR